jgi:hypothetical protein
MRGAKNKGSIEYLGCDIESFRKYLAEKFELGMTWENYGEWEIDHIVPVKYKGADGGPPTLEEVATRLHHTNTQPLWRADNLAKGNRWVGGAQRPEVAQLTDADFDALMESLTL